jgi:hypothetical protein
MKKILYLLLLLYSMNTYSQGLQKYQAVKTSQTGGRFEIAQSEIQRRQTFKLDKYTGTAYVLVEIAKDVSSWQEVRKDVARFDTVMPDVVNYQLFLGGIFARDCFLMNINTGATWVLAQDNKGNFLFQVFE